MNRLVYGFAAVPLVLLLSVATSAENEGSKPNILWIIAEDMSPDIGCYGNKAVATPNLDRLAADGMRFNNVFTTAAACSPSRTALATGVCQTTLGAYHMRYPKALLPQLPRPVKILPQLMRENGYYTGNVRDLAGSGKDDWMFRTTQKSWDARSWSELIRHRPFFGQVNLRVSHRKFKIGKKPVSTKDITIPPYYPDHVVSRADWADYLGAVNMADEYVGTILEQLRRDGLTDKTIVMFFSDHGRPMTRGKNWLYDSGTRIPLLIYYPDAIARPERFKVGGVGSQLISAVDLVAETILMAGGKVPEWMQGRHFLRKDSVSRKYVYTATDRIGNIETCSRAVRSRDYKYIRNYKTPGSVNACSTPYRRANHPIYHLLNVMAEKRLLTPIQEQLLKPMVREELYDLENDPFETVNLIGRKEYVKVHKEMKARLSEWIETSKDKGFEQDSEALVKHFREYGKNQMTQQEENIKRTLLSVEQYFAN
jgi:uncharacterized sulfatase